MVRLLVWFVVAGALLALIFKVASRGGMEREAARTREAALATAPPQAAPVVGDAAAPGAEEAARGIGYGLSFALVGAPATPPTVAHLGCHGDPQPTDRPHEGSCNPYAGDSSCRVVLPVACFRPSGAAQPAHVQADFYKGWTNGQLGATQPVMGALLKSAPNASERCEAELGPGWRMAEFHDGGGGWGLQGERGPGLRPDTRYWVHINDQRGNCWDSAP